nr:immunoglobulin heavy chain junction region [Macaca mulatta]
CATTNTDNSMDVW